jgi:hypothetical protein
MSFFMNESLTRFRSHFSFAAIFESHCHHKNNLVIKTTTVLGYGTSTSHLRTTMSSIASNLNSSLSYLDTIQNQDQEENRDFEVSMSSDIPPLRPEQGKINSAFSPLLEKHKHKAYGRPEDWIGPVPQGSRKHKSWRRKTTSMDGSKHDSFHSAPAVAQMKGNLKLNGEASDPPVVQDCSFHDSFTFQDLVISTEEMCRSTKNLGIDDSQHSVLTEDSKSRFTDLLKMWNSSASISPSVVQEEDDEDDSRSSGPSGNALATQSIEGDFAEKKGSLKTQAPASPSGSIINRSSSSISDMHPCMPELDESVVSSTTASDSITWKSFGTVERGLRPTETLPLRSIQSSRYLRSESSRSFLSTNDSVVSSSSSSHGYHGHNRPDSWVGEQSKRCKRSWRPKAASGISSK